MGLFTRGTREDALAKRERIARAKAAKRGVDVGDALMVLWDWDGKADVFLAIYPDRVTITRGANIGSLIGGGRGAQTIPLSSLSSVDVEQKGLFVNLTFKGSGVDTKFQSETLSGPAAYELINSLRLEAKA